MRRIGILAMAASLVAAPVMAATWVNVTKTSEQLVAVDMESLDVGNVQDVWVLFTTLKPQPDQPATSRQWLQIYCAERQFTIRYYESYTPSGEMTASRTLSDPPIAYSPTSVTAAIAKVSCHKPWPGAPPSSAPGLN